MKYLAYIFLLAAVCLVPVKGTDVGRLIPMEVIAVSEDKGTITVRTDTGNIGSGNTIENAFRDLEQTASGEIYLDTAEYLLLEPGTEDHIRALRSLLKGDVRVCGAPEGIELEGAAKYLTVHKPQTDLESSDEGMIPFLTEENGRYRLLEK